MEALGWWTSSSEPMRSRPQPAPLIASPATRPARRRRECSSHHSPMLFLRIFCHNTTLQQYRLPDVTTTVTRRSSKKKVLCPHQLPKRTWWWARGCGGGGNWYPLCNGYPLRDHAHYAGVSRVHYQKGGPRK